MDQEHTASAFTYKRSDLKFLVVIVKSLKIACRSNKEMESLRTHLVEVRGSVGDSRMDWCLSMDLGN